MGVILSTYDTWDDPPPKTSYKYSTYRGEKPRVGFEKLLGFQTYAHPFGLFFSDDCTKNPFGGIFFSFPGGQLLRIPGMIVALLPRWKVNSKILCMSWTNDGLHVALGLFNGLGLRDGSGGVEENRGKGVDVS